MAATAVCWLPLGSSTSPPAGFVPKASHSAALSFTPPARLLLPADSRDPQHTLLPLPLGQRTEVLSWLFFQNVRGD